MCKKHTVRTKELKKPNVSTKIARCIVKCYAISSTNKSLCFIHITMYIYNCLELRVTRTIDPSM